MRKLLVVFLFLSSGAACAQPSVADAALAEHAELLPANLSISDFTEAPPEAGAIGDAHLFATPFYGPQVYLLVVRLDFEEIAPPLRSNRVSSKLVLRPLEQRLWATLLQLPDDRWPTDGKPDVLAPLLKSLAVGCVDSSPILASSAVRDLDDASDGNLSLGASLAPWRQGQEPVLRIDMATSSNGSGGGTNFSQAWYLSSGRYGLQPLACAPGTAGYWSKPSHDMQGNPQDDGADVSVTWTLAPGIPAAGEDPGQSLELREHVNTDKLDAGKPGSVIARYRWGYDSYQLQSDSIP